MSKATSREKFRIEIRPINPTPGHDRGLWNGYVIIPPGHPWHGMDYDEIDARVHGGLTYSGPEDGGGWVVGFDTAHFGDASMDWPIERVARECNTLMAQACLATYFPDEEV